MTKSARRKPAKSGQSNQQQILIIGGIIAAALLLGVGIIYPMLQPKTPTSVGGAASCSSVQAMKDEGRGHLQPGETPPAYASVPPTSGTHNPVWYPAGIYDKTADITMLIHSLEHGYVILYYNDQLPKDQVQQLISIQQSDPFKLIVAEYPNMPQKIAVAAWDNLQNCDGVNEQVIRSFIAQFRDHGPEQASMN